MAQVSDTTVMPRRTIAGNQINKKMYKHIFCLYN